MNGNKCQKPGQLYTLGIAPVSFNSVLCHKTESWLHLGHNSFTANNSLRFNTVDQQLLGTLKALQKQFAELQKEKEQLSSRNSLLEEERHSLSQHG